MHILIVEDEIQIAESLKKNLRDEGHNAMIAADGEAALKILNEIEFDLILLDWRMPKVTGLEVCKTLRKQGNQTPIILLTALGDISNKVEAFNAGADDYITKPFSFDEVIARINAVMRRSKLSKDLLEFENLTLDLSKRVVITQDKKIFTCQIKSLICSKCLFSKKEKLYPKSNCAKLSGI